MTKLSLFRYTLLATAASMVVACATPAAPAAPAGQGAAAATGRASRSSPRPTRRIR